MYIKEPRRNDYIYKKLCSRLQIFEKQHYVFQHTANNYEREEIHVEEYENQ
jgi:hypothetical protein